MSDHLPECYEPQRNGTRLCICDRLRACEQRTLNDAESHICLCDPGLYRLGHAIALDKARDAVGDLFHDDPCGCDRCVAWAHAQSAISAIGVQE